MDQSRMHSENFDLADLKELQRVKGNKYSKNKFANNQVNGIQNNSSEDEQETNQDSIILDEDEIIHINRPVPRTLKPAHTKQEIEKVYNQKTGNRLVYLQKIQPQMQKLIEQTSNINFSLINNINNNLEAQTAQNSQNLNQIQSQSNQILPDQNQQQNQQNQNQNQQKQLKKINDLEKFKERYQEWVQHLPAFIQPHEDLIFQYDQADPEVKYADLDKQGIINMYRNAEFPLWQLEKGKKETELRATCSSSGGGKKCLNKVVIEKLRGTAKGLLRELGQQILSGKIDLTRLSFPIKTMVPLSGLEKALNSACLFPFYMNRAAEEKNPVERMKLVISATIGHFFINLSFMKPLNPILGETCVGSFPDGTKLYAEQISHHPPITYYQVYGPDNNYHFSGYYNYSSSAGINSLSLKNTGKRQIKFKDGGLIKYNFGNETYHGTFWGSTKIECVGRIQFTDSENNLEGKVLFDKGGFGKPSDFVEGSIKRQNEKICKIRGSFMGFILFDERVYWHYKQQIAIKPKIEFSGLESDHFYRTDKVYLERGYDKRAQEEKERLENIQRGDRKLREQFQKEKKKKDKKK